jgi:hypothetical protein
MTQEAQHIVDRGPKGRWYPRCAVDGAEWPCPESFGTDAPLAGALAALGVTHRSLPDYVTRARSSLQAAGLSIVSTGELEGLRRVRDAAQDVMARYSEQGHCDDAASWAGFDRLDAALEGAKP